MYIYIHTVLQLHDLLNNGVIAMILRQQILSGHDISNVTKS